MLKLLLFVQNQTLQEQMEMKKNHLKYVYHKYMDFIVMYEYERKNYDSISKLDNI